MSIIDGTWNITMKTPMGVKEGKLEFKTDGTSLTGTMSPPSPLPPIEILNGKVEGNTLSFSAKATPMTIEATLTVEGDKIHGEAKMGFMGKSTISGVRA